MNPLRQTQPTEVPREVAPGQRFTDAADFVRNYITPKYDHHRKGTTLAFVFFDKHKRVLCHRFVGIGPLPERRIDMRRRLNLSNPPANARYLVPVITDYADEVPEFTDAQVAALRHLWSVSIDDHKVRMIDAIVWGPKYFVRGPYSKIHFFDRWEIEANQQ